MSLPVDALKEGQTARRRPPQPGGYRKDPDLGTCSVCGRMLTPSCKGLRCWQCVKNGRRDKAPEGFGGLAECTQPAETRARDCSGKLWRTISADQDVCLLCLRHNQRTAEGK